MGLVSGDIFARAADLDLSEVLFTELSSYAGCGLGAGIVLLDQDGSGTALALAGSLGGWGLKALTGLFAGRLQFRPNDTWEYFLGQGFGAWQGLGFSMIGGASDRQKGGGALLGLSAGFLLPMLSNQFQDFSFLEDVFIAGGAALGTWIGGWGMYALSDDTDGTLLGALLGGDVGLLLAGLALSDWLGVSTWSTGWTQLTSMGGMALGVSLTAVLTSDSRTIAGGMALGSAAGLVAGVIWTALVDPPTETPAPVRSKPAPGRPADGPIPSGSARHGLVPVVPLPTFFLLPPPPGNENVPPAMIVGLQGVWDL
jgi:hypothetical protein